MQATIITQKMDKLEARINRLGRKAEKLGLPPVELIVGETRPETRKIDGREVRYFVTDVEIIGADVTPKINGWVFLAQLQHTPAGNIVRSFVENIGDDYRTAPADCDHCGHDRNRKTTYVLQNEETEETIQVGSTCVADFLRDVNAESIANYYANITIESFLSEDEFQGDDWNLSFGDSQTSIVEYFACVLTAVEVRGYHGSSSYETPTKFDAWDIYHLARKNWEGKITEASEKIALVRDYIASQERVNDYLHNMATILADDFMVNRSAGYVASVYPLWAKIVEQEVFEKTEKLESNWVGQPGEKIQNVELTLGRIFSWDTQYGVKELYKFADDAGNIYTWIPSTPPATKNTKIFLEEGCRYNMIVGTIKANAVYNGKKQNTIFRCKFDEILDN